MIPKKLASTCYTRQWPYFVSNEARTSNDVESIFFSGRDRERVFMCMQKKCAQQKKTAQTDENKEEKETLAEQMGSIDAREQNRKRCRTTRV